MATLLEMENKVRRNLGDRTTGSNQRFSADLIRDLINEAYFFYAGVMIESGEGDFAMPPETIDIVSGQVDYDLNQLFEDGDLSYYPVKIRLVEKLIGTEWVTLDKWEKNTGVMSTTGLSSQSWLPSYRFTGTNITFNIPPDFNEAGGLRISGYKIPDDLVEDEDEFHPNFNKAWHGMTILRATIGCIESKESTGMVGDPDQFRKRLEQYEGQFFDFIQNRSESRESADPFVVAGEE